MNNGRSADFYSWFYLGKQQANILEGTVDDTPLMFIEKEIVAVRIDNAFVQGTTGLLSSACEVYPNQGFNTDVCLQQLTLLFLYF